MTKLSTSPELHSRRRDTYLKQLAKSGETPSPERLAMIEDDIESRRQWDEELPTREWDLEYDLRTTDWILEKVRGSESYAQNLYAAMCNNQFQRREVWPILKDQYWSCSWRSAGGIIANMREQGDYLDWYCSGIKSDDEDGNGFVGESAVTEEIEQDLLKLGWNVIQDGETSI
jgi:hypothetical protein